VKELCPSLKVTHTATTPATILVPTTNSLHSSTTANAFVEMTKKEQRSMVQEIVEKLEAHGAKTSGREFLNYLKKLALIKIPATEH